MKGCALVIDDSEILLDTVQEALANEGWEVETAVTSEKALAVALSRPLDVVLCDLHMPEMDGLGVLRRLHAIDALLPVIILSGDGELSAALATIREGAFDFVSKDSDMRPLLAAIGRAKTHGSVARENKRLAEELQVKQQELDTRNKDLERMSRLKSEFLASMSHELRTPMNAIIGFTDLTLSRAELDTKSRKNLERVLSNARHLLGLINDVLDLSKIEAGKLELVVEETDLSLLLEEVAQSVDVLLKGKPVTLALSVASGLPKIRTDKVKLRQIVLNLLSNAAKFTQAGEVSLRASVIEGRRMGDLPAMIRIDVQDSGIGIDPKDQKVIFEEFRQVDSTTSRRYGGTGLGLAIVKRMLLLMGGDVSVQSSIGAGSTFTVVLPLLPPGAAGEQAATSTRLPQRSTQP